jgi:geranylgeranyl diphosphate synthase, type II
MSLSAYLEARRAEIDTALASALPRPPATPAVVYDAMRYSLMAGGKRLRPVLCLASAEAVGGNRAAAMPAACAIELIHTYSLIHDDLPAMDDDGLLTEAFALLARGLPAAAGNHDAPGGFRLEAEDLLGRRLRAIGVIATAAGSTGMVGGQAVDLASVGAPLDAAGVHAMHAMKTGALIRAAAAAGAIMGGGSDAAVSAIERAAAELGLAFQIVDDVLDVEGASKDLGKTAGKDAASGKPTYPALYGLDRSRLMASECLARAEAILHDERLAHSRLLEIGRWIVTRAN